MEDETRVKAARDAWLKELNATEATWLAWAKANKVKLAVALVGLVIAIVCAVKLA